MKKIITICIIFISLSVFANNSSLQKIDKQEKIPCAIENYRLCLQHENPGVVESTLGNVIKLKYKCPKLDMSLIEKELLSLSEYGVNKNIRSKASLVLKILKNPELVKEIGIQFYANVDQFLDFMIITANFRPLITANISD